VPKNGNANDIITGLIKKAKLEDEEQAGPIRLYEVHSSKIHRELGRETVVQSITDYVSLVAERIPEEDINPPEDSEFIQAFHFHTDSSRTHGIPFQFLMIPVSLQATSNQETVSNHNLGRVIFGDQETTREAYWYQRKGLREDQICGGQTQFILEARVSDRWYVVLFADKLDGPQANRSLEMILDNVITADDDLLGLDHQDKSRPQRNGAVDLFLK